MKPAPANKLSLAERANIVELCNSPAYIQLPPTHQFNGPCEVWCWDITYYPSTVRGQFYYFYLFEDLFSRKIVGYEVYEAES